MAIFFSKKIKSQDYSWFMTAWRKGVTIKNIFIVFLFAIESTFFPKINLVKLWTFFVSLFISEYYYTTIEITLKTILIHNNCT